MCCDQTCVTDWGLFLWKKPLDLLCKDWDSCGFFLLPRSKKARAGATQWRTVLVLSRVLPQVGKYLYWYMLAKCWNSTKATSSDDLGKGLLGLPLSWLHLSGLSCYQTFWLCSAAFMNVCLHNFGGVPQFFCEQLMLGLPRFSVCTASWFDVERCYEAHGETCGSDKSAFCYSAQHMRFLFFQWTR